MADNPEFKEQSETVPNNIKEATPELATTSSSPNLLKIVEAISKRSDLLLAFAVIAILVVLDLFYLMILLRMLLSFQYQIVLDLLHLDH